MSSLGAQQSMPPAETITSGMLQALRQTRPWVRFLSILGILVSLFLLAVGVGIGTVGPMFGGDQIPPALMIGLGALYVVMAVFYLIPAFYLFRYASAITGALNAPLRAPSLEEALRLQKSFWKYIGVMAILVLLLQVVAVIAAIVIPGVFLAMMQGR